MSAALGFSNVASITYRQQAVPTELAGRVNAVIRMFITGAVPLSGFIYAGSSHLDGFRLWVPALAIAGASVAVWSVYAYHRERTGRNGRDLAHRTTPIWSRS
jgi:uncharacterized membrane protein